MCHYIVSGPGQKLVRDGQQKETRLCELSTVLITDYITLKLKNYCS